MRRVVVLAVALVVLTGGALVLPGDDAATGSSGRLQIVTTTTVFADLIQLVAGPDVDVRSLVPVGGDPHIYEPRPSDARHIAEADLVVVNGLGLSPWVDPLLDARDGPVRVLTDSVGAVATGADGVVDPHLWMVPAIVAEHYVPAIAAALEPLLEAAQREALIGRTAAARRELLALHDEIADHLATIPIDQRLLVTTHDAYGYFADAFELRVVDTIVGVTTEEQPSAQHVAAIVDQVIALQVPTVFIESTVNPDVMQRIAGDSGAQIGAPLYGDSLGAPGSGADTYDGMLRHNARAIAEGLQ